MSERVLTERHLNRALLARQLLLERAKTPIPKALDRIGGIQAQYARRCTSGSGLASTASSATS